MNKPSQESVSQDEAFSPPSGRSDSSGPVDPNGFDSADGPPDPSRRRAIGWFGTAGLFAALAAAYGTLAAMAGRFLFPVGPPKRGWMFVARADSIAPGGALTYRTPAGATVNVARQGAGLATADYIALSSTCPHLGCQVQWQPQNDRFFCPCHNGVFDARGVATGGPPAEAGQSLPQYPLRIDGDLLFLEVPLDQLAAGEGQVIDRVAPAAISAVAATAPAALAILPTLTNVPLEYPKSSGCHGCGGCAAAKALAGAKPAGRAKGCGGSKSRAASKDDVDAVAGSRAPGETSEHKA